MLNPPPLRQAHMKGYLGASKGGKGLISSSAVIVEGEVKIEEVEGVEAAAAAPAVVASPKLRLRQLRIPWLFKSRVGRKTNFAHGEL